MHQKSRMIHNITRKIIFPMGIIFLLAGALAGCAGQPADSTKTDAKPSAGESTNQQADAQPSTGENTNQPIDTAACTIPYEFADAEEGIALRMANTDYFNNLTQNDLDYRTGKKGATLEEFKALAEQQGDTFTEEEKQAIADSIDRLEARFQEIGFSYPANSKVVFVKNKMKDEFGAVAYTQSNQIYLEGENLDFMQEIPGLLDGMIAHELFHVLSRNNPDFRQAIYSVLGFTIAEEPDFTPEIRAILGSNPDVEQFDSYALFDIEGQPTKAVVVTLLKNPYQERQYLFDHFSTGIVPYDNPDRYYTIDEVPNFWEVFGENSDYVITTEEAIADNFTSAVVYGMDGREYKNPEIIQSILDVLANYHQQAS